MEKLYKIGVARRQETRVFLLIPFRKQVRIGFDGPDGVAFNDPAGNAIAVIAFQSAKVSAAAVAVGEEPSRRDGALGILPGEFALELRGRPRPLLGAMHVRPNLIINHVEQVPFWRETLECLEQAWMMEVAHTKALALQLRYDLPLEF